ncbi:MAG TPA: hypothetical protein VF219_15640 [Vicinamibacterales bacterium]
MTKFAQICTVAVLVTLSAACNNSSSNPNAPGSTGAGRATFTVSVKPSPITAQHCNPQCPGDGSGSYAFAADMTVNVQETSGIGGNATQMTLTASAGGTTFQPLTFTADDITQQAGTHHVDGHATLAIPMSIVYNTPSGAANLTINVSIQITDDRNNQVTATGQVNVI